MYVFFYFVLLYNGGRGNTSGICERRKNMKANNEIRTLAAENNIYIWQIADKLGVHENTLLRWMRKELPKETKDKILNAINEIRGE